MMVSVVYFQWQQEILFLLDSHPGKGISATEGSSWSPTSFYGVQHDFGSSRSADGTFDRESGDWYSGEGFTSLPRTSDPALV